MNFSAVEDYGPIRVVTNLVSGSAFSSAPGPDGLPVILSFTAGTAVSAIVSTTASACLRAWTERGPGTPEKLARGLRAATDLDFALLQAVSDRTAAGASEHGYTHAIDTKGAQTVG